MSAIIHRILYRIRHGKQIVQEGTPIEFIAKLQKRKVSSWFSFEKFG